MTFQHPNHGRKYAVDRPANLETKKPREELASRPYAHMSLDGTEVLALPTRFALANDLRYAGSAYQSFLQVGENNGPAFGAQNAARKEALSPEDDLFAGSNAFYADNYPVNQSAPIMPPGYNDSAYADSSPNISPPSGLISPQTGQSYQPYYPYSEAGGTGYTPSPGSVSDDNQAKRARNTAASARFRAKKKEREQELERSTNHIKNTVTKLEAKVVQLETENRWLKDLVTGKIKTPLEEREGGEKGNSEPVIDDWESHRHTDGVGTSSRSGRMK